MSLVREALSFSDPVVYAVPFFIAFIIIESLISSAKNLKLYEKKDAAASIAMGLGSLVIGVGMKILAFIAFTFLYQFAFFDIGYQWWAWVLLFFADDLTFYIHHRSCHEVRLLWAAHVNHHSSQKLNYGTAVRQSWTELLYKYIWWMWLPLVGFPPLMILTMMSINLIYQFLAHTEMVGKLGPLEWIFNTPSHHRVHHASNIRYLDRNHAGILIIWDRIFGTFQEELDDENPVYGLTKNIDTYNPLRIATHEFADIVHDLKKPLPWSIKIKYLYMPPGWDPEGKTKTTSELQKELRESN